MLHALYELAQDEGLLADPDFEPKPVAWLIRVNDAGKLVGKIESTYYTPPAEGKKKPKPAAKTFRVPRQPGRTSGDLAFFFCDKAEYVVGQIAPGDPDLKDVAKRKKKEAKLESRRDLFIEQVRACAESIDDAGAAAVLKFLERIAAGKQDIDLDKETRPNDLFAFIYTDDGKLVHERTKVKMYWSSLRTRSSVDQAGSRRTKQICLVTGELVEPVEKFPLIKRVPGGVTSGVGLVSFNSNAFLSHGWDGNENAPIGEEAANACRDALNRLLDPAYPDPKSPGQTLAPRHIRLSDDTVVCYWGRGKQGEELSDLMADILNPDDPNRVGDLYRALWTGKAPTIDDPSAFYAVTLSGAQGRAVVRDWLESTVGETWGNLRRYFNDLDIVRNTPMPKNSDLPPVLPLRVLLRSLAPLGDEKAIPDPLAAKFLHAALCGSPFPLAVLQGAIERARAEIGRSEWADLERRDGRAALIKAVLLRRQHTSIGVAMNPAAENPGYNLGCLMAVLERLQEAALDNVNASVVDRYFGAASATPRSVFTRLLRNAQHHARKARDSEKNSGLAFLLKKMIDELASRFGVDMRKQGYPSPMGFPSFLPLEEQGLFMLGYHQMRKWLWMTKEERAAWNNDHPNAPSAFQWSAKTPVAVAEA